MAVFVKATSLVNDPHSKDRFDLCFEKALEYRNKFDLLMRLGYGGFEVVVATSVKHRICHSPSIPGFYRYIDEHEIQALPDHPRVIWLLNSNLAEIGFQNLSRLKQGLPKSLFIVHDFDHHHWELGTLSSLEFSDVYISAHPYKPVLTERYNENSHFLIGAGCLQFSMGTVIDYLSRNSVKRDRGPYGPYFFYPNFHFRNAVIQTLNQSYSSVYLKQRISYDLPGELAQLEEWCSYVSHWIVPVGGDLPNRFFDALCTGGIPIVPVALEHFIKSLGVSKSHFVTYTFADILSPEKVVKEAEQFFYDSSAIDRSALYLDKFQYCLQVKRFCETLFQC